jgi:hypothetical protein
MGQGKTKLCFLTSHVTSKQETAEIATVSVCSMRTDLTTFEKLSNLTHEVLT